jgi:SHS family lactate transporter-like MFS transporter
VTDVAETFGKKTNADITWAITLVLMFRSIGSTLFGIAADLYGRKWEIGLELSRPEDSNDRLNRPFIVNNILFIVLELATGFCQNYRQFLAMHAL